MRRFVAGKVRTAVAGRSPEQRHAELFESDGPRWFEPDSPIQRVHADSAMFVGGLRALLLQSLHPLAMAGVAEHSDYRADPWGRLQRTADFLAATTYGPATEAERAVARVRAVHTRVHGHRVRRPSVRGQRPAPAALGARRRGRQLPRRQPPLRARTRSTTTSATSTCARWP